jgi:integrase
VPRVAVTARDKHGTYTRARRDGAPGTRALDRQSLRWFAVVDNVWSKGFATKREAEAEERKMKDDDSASLRHSALTVSEFLKQVWLPLVDAKVARGQMKSTTAAHYRIVVDKYVEPAIGSTRLRDLKPTHLRKLYADLTARGLAAKTVRNVHVLISNALALAAADGYVTRNAAKGRDVAPSARSAEMKAWDAVQVRAFLTHAKDDRHFAAWRLVATCGLRRGEVLALRWSDVELDKGTLTVRRSLVVSPDTKALVWQTPKTDRSQRTIDVDLGTVGSLRALRKAQTAERLQSPVGWPEGDDPAADLIFTDEVGKPIRPATFSARFDALVRGAGVERIRLHDLRHTAATLMLREGVPVHVVSERLGHASASITMDVYAHVLRDQRTDAATRIAAAIDG